MLPMGASAPAAVVTARPAQLRPNLDPSTVASSSIRLNRGTALPSVLSVIRKG